MNSEKENKVESALNEYFSDKLEKNMKFIGEEMGKALLQGFEGGIKNLKEKEDKNTKENKG
ncbi:hypothetical protein SAMN04487761_101101 [Lachnospiraceae bacterium C7]|nr:hypothetical protein SAMN04487761_101101 [Lachnospiraceae bacterium C7]